MTIELVHDSYGKSAIRMVKVSRHGRRHEVRDLTIDVRLEGAFERAHTEGDNSMILPTDTMKNTVYALAKDHTMDPPEHFALALGEHFLGAAPAATRVHIAIETKPWNRVTIGGRGHDHSFSGTGGPRRIARISASRGQQVAIEAGIEGLEVLKSSGSGFEGFLVDRYTTLAQTSERILATSISARWRYVARSESFGPTWHAVRQFLLETFAEHPSRSVQHTLHAMGAAILSQFAEIEEIHLTMPNRHHLLVDLSPFGQSNDDEIWVATDAPFGLIEATLRRVDAAR